MKSVDLNADVGEGFSTDSDLLKYVSSANIACGLHAGSPIDITRTVHFARENKVSIGAHPGYPDRDGFGRKKMNMSFDELVSIISYQIGALNGILLQNGDKLKHVKAHGALYNSASTDSHIARAIAQSVVRINPKLKIFGPHKSKLQEEAKKEGLSFVSEVFADRAYNNDGSLVSRSLPGALIHDTSECTERVLMMIEEGKVKTINGDYINIIPDTICVHGDNKEAVLFAKNLSIALRSNGIIIKSK